ncbi:cytochrome c oxidase subunit I [Halosimplex carlsbadense 2-9-1]|uniref:cytochrome-c oxidase n=1 Tax=Halosimplex carlsbadense 2-9-1 TaxID=797114 RepID=M0CKP0_9EURY|nr:cytochrome c oxidase subunit I [Halosimplex carlsbadense 2-9-1]
MSGLLAGLAVVVPCVLLAIVWVRTEPFADSPERRDEPAVPSEDATQADDATPATDGGTVRAKPLGPLRWLTTVDHRDVGLLYLAFGTVAGLWGGMDAMMMRTELLTASVSVWDAETYNALFTTHGITMLFFFAAPVFAGIANYVIPLLIGADDMAFPRINALAFWLLPPALLIARAGIVTELIGKTLEGALGLLPPNAMAPFGGLGTVVDPLLALEPPGIGWTMYTPLSIQDPNQQVNLLLLGLHLSGVATTMGAINFIATIVSERGEEVSWADLDLFSWNILTQSGIILFAFPLLGSAMVMLLLDRVVGTTFFAVDGGGPILWQHLFWFFGHPEVYILVLPAFGLVSYILPKFAGRELFGFRFVVYSTLAIGVLSFGVWAHHMFATGIDPRVRASFMFVSIAIAVPSAVKTFNWIATLWNGRVRLTAPMLFCLGGLALFVVGGITGVFLAAIPFNLVVHDTYYVVGHFHLIVMGVIPFSMFAACYYWFPMITGRWYNRPVAVAQALVLSVGSAVTFLPMLVTGTEGLPRRYAAYPQVFELLNQVSSAGAYLIGLAAVLWVFNMVQSYRVGPPVTDDDVWDLAETDQRAREWHHPAGRPTQRAPAVDDAAPEDDESDERDAGTDGDEPTDDTAPDGDPAGADASAEPVRGSALDLSSSDDAIGGRGALRLVAVVTVAIAVLVVAGRLLLPLTGFDSTTEALIRTLNRRLLLVAVPLALLVEAVLVYAVWRFRGGVAVPTPDNTTLEISWTVATAFVLLFVAVVSYGVLGSPFVTATPEPAGERPADAVEIEIVAEQFDYDVRYTGANVSVESTDVIYAPTDRPVYFEVRAEDVLHSVHVPALGLKQDAFPAQWNLLHTRLLDPGDYRLYCAEFCGVGHSRMRTTLSVVPPEQYRQRVDALADGNANAVTGAAGNTTAGNATARSPSPRTG